MFFSNDPTEGISHFLPNLTLTRYPTFRTTLKHVKHNLSARTWVKPPNSDNSVSLSFGKNSPIMSPVNDVEPYIDHLEWAQVMYVSRPR